MSGSEIKMEKCGCQKVSIKCFLHIETHKRKVFQDVSSHENIPAPERSQESDSTCKGIKIYCSLQLILVEIT